MKLSRHTRVFGSTLESIVRAYLILRVYSIGSFKIRQLKGIPIGGPLSTARPDLALCYLEWTYDNAHPGRALHVLATRFVDDLLGALLSSAYHAPRLS